MSWVDGLKNCESKIFSSAGEDGIIEEIFRNIGTTNKYFVEFGATTAANNTDNLAAQGWNGLLMGNVQTGLKWKIKNWLKLLEGRFAEIKDIKNEFVTAENINDLFCKYSVPKIFDFLSIDIDGNDFWVWKAIDEAHFKARVVCIEFNSNFSLNQSFTIKYNPNHLYAKNKYYGASLLAMKKLGELKGYRLIYTIGCMNAFFIENKLLSDLCIPSDIEHFFHYPIDVKSFYQKWGINDLPTWYQSPEPFELSRIDPRYVWEKV
jgi:hypothetical protein